MKNKKGFTLVELLAMLVVLGILMVVAIPNMNGILGNQRLNGYKQDAENLVEAAKIKVAKDTTIDKPAVGQCLYFSLDSLDDNDDFTTGPNGGEYLRYESMVIYTREITAGTTSQLKFYVRLVEKKDDNNYLGFALRESSEIKNLKNKDIDKITSTQLYGVNADRAGSLTKLNTRFNTESGSVMKKCNSATSKYYTHIKKCIIENGIYYGSNGNAVSEAVYNAECS